MRVRLRSDAEIPERDQARFAAWLDRDREYVVLEVSGDSVRFQTEPDADFPGVWESKYFEVTDDRIPPNWTTAIAPDGDVWLAPRGWLQPDFWSALCDDEPPVQMTWNQRTERYRAARQTFTEDVRVIIDADRSTRDEP